MRIKVRFYLSHVRTYSWLHKLRNTQGKIYEAYLRNRYVYIYIYGIYKQYIRNIQKYLWYGIIRNTGAAFGGRTIGTRRRQCLCSWLFYIIIFYGYSLYIPYIFPKYVPYISLVCFLIYGGKSRSGHDRSQNCCSILHVSGPKLTFWCNLQMVLHGFAWRS